MANYEKQRKRIEQFLGYRLSVNDALFNESKANIDRSNLDKSLLSEKKFTMLRDWMDLHGY